MSLFTDVVRHHGRRAAQLDTDNIYDLNFDDLLCVTNPENWPAIRPSFFTAMIPNGVTHDGWDRYIEHVAFYPMRLRTPLRFRTSEDEVRFRMDYDIDTEWVDPRRIDTWVTVDHGHIEVTRYGSNQVRCRTRKVIKIDWMSPLLGIALAPILGWESWGSEFFHSAAALSQRDHRPCYEEPDAES